MRKCKQKKSQPGIQPVAPMEMGNPREREEEREREM
jgi:hypothetical protein